MKRIQIKKGKGLLTIDHVRCDFFVLWQMCQINSERVTHALKAIAYTDDIGARIFDCYCQFLVSFLNGKDYFLVFPPFEVWMIFAKWLWMWWKTVQEIYKLNQLCWLDIQLSG